MRDGFSSTCARLQREIRTFTVAALRKMSLWVLRGRILFSSHVGKMVSQLNLEDLGACASWICSWTEAAGEMKNGVSFDVS